MELTLDQALKKGIAAHKAGKAVEAERFYKAILNVNKHHPEANHNLGILAFEVGKVEAAIPFFKTAIAANPKIEQFWISYINVLIHVGRLDEAEEVAAKAMNNEIKTDALIKLAQRLLIKEDGESPNSQKSIINQAIDFRDVGKFEEAIELLKNGIKEFPNISSLHAMLAHCHLLNDEVGHATSHLEKAKKIDPNSSLVQWNTIRLLVKNKNFKIALEMAREGNKNFPEDTEGMAILASCLRLNGYTDECFEILNKIIISNPYYAEALIDRALLWLSQNNKSRAISDLDRAYKAKPHIKQIWDLLVGLKVASEDFEGAVKVLEQMLEFHSNDEKIYKNLAYCYQKLEKFDLALDAYTKVINLESGSAETYNNMGVLLKNQRQLDNAIDAYKKAVSINPDFAEAFNNLANAFKQKGKLKEAIKSYTNAIESKPNYSNAIENLFTIKVQLLNSGINPEFFYVLKNQDLINMPKHQILQAISAFIMADRELCRKKLESYNNYNPEAIVSLPSRDKLFCAAYQNFLGKLIEQFIEKPASSNEDNFVYHLGESHCLSYSNHYININGSIHKVLPMITFGAKAFHFSQEGENEFKAITMANFQAIPEKSEVFISFGEIDCRFNEGFLLAVGRHKKSLQDLILDTVNGYLKWFAKQNSSYGHNLHIFNVPAPLFDKELSNDVNLKVAKVVALFNTILSKSVDIYGFRLIDTFQFTSDKNGFSNKIFHIDKRHLSSKAIKEIENQLIL